MAPVTVGHKPIGEAPVMEFVLRMHQILGKCIINIRQCNSLAFRGKFHMLATGGNRKNFKNIKFGKFFSDLKKENTSADP